MRVWFAGFEPHDHLTLRARLTVRAGRPARVFAATAQITSTGQLIDLQTDEHVGTTGFPDADRLIAEVVADELVRARSALVVAEFDRQRQQPWPAPRPLRICDMR